jgi:hypothetical protein
LLAVLHAPLGCKNLAVDLLFEAKSSLAESPAVKHHKKGTQQQVMWEVAKSIQHLAEILHLSLAVPSTATPEGKTAIHLLEEDGDFLENEQSSPCVFSTTTQALLNLIFLLGTSTLAQNIYRLSWRICRMQYIAVYNYCLSSNSL